MDLFQLAAAVASLAGAVALYRDVRADSRPVPRPPQRQRQIAAWADRNEVRG